MDRKEWLQLRKNYIGASDAGVIMNGVHFNKTPYQLWQEKLGIAKSEKDSAAMRMGREMEPQIRSVYQDYTNSHSEPKIVFHPVYKFMMASLDGFDEDKKIGVEIKCLKKDEHQDVHKGQMPERYFPQVQHQMACMEAPMMHFFSYFDEDYALLEIERDDKYLDSLYKKEAEFWDHVLNLEAPDLNENDYLDMSSVQGWKERAAQWLRRKELLKSLEEEDKKDRQWFLDQCQKHNAQGHGIKITQSFSPGRVNYNSIPELIGVDLNKYRKKPIERWLFKDI